MTVNIQDDILKLHALGLLDKLLADKTTGGRILWAADAYTDLGPGYGRDEEITPEQITGPHAGVIKTRARKELEQRSARTRQHGEVFTPLWVCRKMCDAADAARMGGGVCQTGRKPDGGQNAAGPAAAGEGEGEASRKPGGWKKYVDARVLEITCGEAPFLASRYDMETGEAIPVAERTGLLDRKLWAVNGNTRTEEEWLKWTFRAFQATYGYEFQGDNLLIARVNLLMSFAEYLWERWRRKPTQPEYTKLVHILVWNLWQMDGLRGTIPYGTAEEEAVQTDLFSLLAGTGEPEQGNLPPLNPQPPCRVYDWRGGQSAEYRALSTRGKHAMKFDFIIGNPPYQDETVGEQKTFAPPIYHLFLDEAYKVADKVELIHPARFLFNAGGTPKSWNEKMLQDPHLKVLFHEQDSSKIFANTDIKGGVAVTYRDAEKDFGAMEIYTAFPELNRILKKVKGSEKFEPLSDMIFHRGLYRFSQAIYDDHPDEMKKFTDSRIGASSFERLPLLFTEEKPNDDQDYVQIYGLLKSRRVYRWLRKDYVKLVDSFYRYNVFVPAANGSGALGEVLSTPMIGQPMIGHTETFLSIGSFETEYEARSCMKYIKSKFARAMLGVLKITQHNSPEKWNYVPVQNWGPDSDIDWSRSIPEIDRQLYRKYGLDETEIRFIETHIKEME